LPCNFKEKDSDLTSIKRLRIHTSKEARMDKSFRSEIKHILNNPNILSTLSEFDVRNSVLKLFRNLGWNVYNEGLNPLDYEVSQEKTIESGRPDLTFLIGGEPRFYVESKKASKELGGKDVWQAWKYAWNSGLPFSVLSNFLYTWLIDCRATPPQEAPNYWKDLIIKSWSLTHLTQQYEEIKALLGKVEVQKGSLTELEKALESSSDFNNIGVQTSLFPLKGVIPVDEMFLNQLDKWRIIIAKNLYARNKSKSQIIKLTDQIINFTVFVRFLEDRKLLHETSLKDIIDSSLDRKGLLQREINSLRSRLNLLYNGTVFKEVEGGFSIDESIFREIIYNLYAPNSPYQFDYISVDILGTIYERFLGKKITIDKSTVHYQDDLESRRERKEGGVFYTERYITNFMVNQILRCALNTKDPETIFGLRIADITCGSGSFLITAYRNMMFWFESVCEQHSALRKRYLYRLPDGSWKLKIDYKIKILEDCIYGVDIDPEAVDVTKFSLYLQLLERETEDNIRTFFNRAKKPVLPILDKNVKCGNSLVDYSIAEFSLFTKDVEKIINPFNLKEFFKEVFVAGGFNIIVGNPPYNAKLHNMEKEYCRQYSLSKGNLNSANLFIERVDNLARTDGAWTLIVPKSLIYSEKWIASRKHLQNRLIYAVDASKAFKNVKLEQVIIGCKRDSDSMVTGNINKAGQYLFTGRRKLSFTDIIPVNINDKEIEIGEKIVKNSVSFSDYFRLLRGSVPLKSIRDTGDVKVYQGRHIQGYHLMSASKGISTEEAILYEKYQRPKLMFQQIVSHSMSPLPHVRLIGALDELGDCLSIDTVSNLFLINSVSHLKEIDALLLGLAVLNSRTMSWFSDRFIYAKAIRTMHFDNYQLNKMRFPADLNSNVAKTIIRLSRHITSMELGDSKFMDKSVGLEKQINTRVAELFGLNADEADYIDSFFGNEYMCNMGLLGRGRGKLTDI
jgi:predicted type IV restriction endonuclease